MASKYYAVKKGKVPGIYLNWNDCKAMVDGYPGAVYKSFKTIEEAEKFIVTNLAEAGEASSKNVGMKDHKTVLQEKLQEHGTVHINYEVIKTSGPDHDKSFTVEVYCDGKALAIGEGKTKKQAEMQAAEKALEKLA